MAIKTKVFAASGSGLNYAPLKILSGDDLKNFKLLCKFLLDLNISTTMNSIAKDFLGNTVYENHSEMMKDARTLFAYFGRGDLYTNVIQPMVQELKDLK